MEKPWLGSYQQGIPETIDPSIHRTLVDLLQTSCQHFQTRPAFENMSFCLSYEDFYKKTQAFASFLQHSGLQK